MQQDVLFYQRFLKCNGFYNDKLDGHWGANTDTADKAFQQRTTEIAAAEGTFDPRSERYISTLAPKAQIAARRFLTQCKKFDMEVRIISGTRTYEEQEEIFAQGRTKPGKIVTKARGGQSNHNFGIAWDIGIFDGGQYIVDDARYIAKANQVLALCPGLEWGGNWHSIKDYPHYQLKAISDDLVAVKNAFEAGQPYA